VGGLQFESSLPEAGTAGLLENCASAFLESGESRFHQAQAARDQGLWHASGNQHEFPRPPPINRRRFAGATVKQLAETSQAREADLQAHLGDGLIAGGQQLPCAFQARKDPVLVRRRTKDRGVAPDELASRKPGLAGHRVDRQRPVSAVVQLVAGAT
jgi:hypothetical protein